MHVIPQSWSHVHILISVFPSVGLAIVLGFFIAGLRTGNEVTKQICLTMFALVALLSIPIYFSGNAATTALTGNARFSKDMITTHYAWAVPALAVLVLTGVLAGFRAVAEASLWRLQDHAVRGARRGDDRSGAIGRHRRSGLDDQP
jgi:hypothetical protein